MKAWVGIDGKGNWWTGSGWTLDLKDAEFFVSEEKGRDHFMAQPASVTDVVRLLELGDGVRHIIKRGIDDRYFAHTPETGVGWTTDEQYAFVLPSSEAAKSVTHGFATDWMLAARPWSPPTVAKAVVLPDGYHCKRCSEYCAWSEPNQTDGSFVCRGCRS